MRSLAVISLAVTSLFCCTKGEQQLPDAVLDMTLDAALQDATAPDMITPDTVRHAVCGDGKIEGTEQCEGADLRSKTCLSLGYDAGALACKADCSWDITGCTLAPPLSIAVGYAGSTCLVKKVGTLWCWGRQIGSYLLPSRPTPQQVGSETDWRSVTAGGGHMCALQGSGHLYCWGFGNYGQIGDGTTANRPAPAHLPGSPYWAAVSAGDNHTCAIMKDGTLSCWGDNRSGQLGDGTTTNRSTYTQVGKGTSWGAAAAGGYHTCALSKDKSLWCWGDNSEGQLGDGTKKSRTSPAKMAGAAKWVTVSAGYNHTCATRTDGSLWCWGDNSAWQLGGTQATAATSPVKVSGGGKAWSRVSTGANHTCAARADGTLWCWGTNYAGQLGKGPREMRAAPGQVGTATNYQLVAAGRDHTCATRADASVWCWGFDGDGELGVGTPQLRTSPVKVVISQPLKALTAYGLNYGGHTCALGVSSRSTRPVIEEFVPEFAPTVPVLDTGRDVWDTDGQRASRSAVGESVPVWSGVPAAWQRAAV